MPQCHNCGNELQSGMKFCPACGQDQSIVVPQEERIPTEDVPIPPPPPFDTQQGTSPQGTSQPASNTPRRKWLIGAGLGCGGLALLVLALLVVGIVSGTTNKTAQSGGEGDENGKSEEKPEAKKKSGPENVTAKVGESAQLRDRTLVVNEVERHRTNRRALRARVRVTAQLISLKLASIHRAAESLGLLGNSAHSTCLLW